MTPGAVGRIMEAMSVEAFNRTQGMRVYRNEAMTLGDWQCILAAGATEALRIAQDEETAQFVPPTHDETVIAKREAITKAAHRFTGNGPGVLGADNCQICGRFRDKPETIICKNGE